MKKMIEISVAALMVLSLNVTFTFAQVDGSKPVRDTREELLLNNTVDLLYTIDDYYTFVEGAGLVIEKNDEDFTVIEEGTIGASRYLIMKHAKKQSFAYKSRAIAPYGEVSMPAQNELTLGIYRGVDLYEQMYAVCAKTNGSMTFVVPRRYGSFKRLTEVSAPEAFSYILTEKGNSFWYMACDGEKRFVVEKNYNFKKGSPEKATVSLRRGLEGVNYVKNGSSVPASVTSVASHLERSRYIEETAWEVATLKTNFVKVHDGSRYEGFYKNDSSGCSTVSVKAKAPHEEGNALLSVSRVYDFKVCGVKVAKMGEREENSEGDMNIRTDYRVVSNSAVLK